MLHWVKEKQQCSWESLECLLRSRLNQGFLVVLRPGYLRLWKKKGGEEEGGKSLRKADGLPP